MPRPPLFLAGSIVENLVRKIDSVATRGVLVPPGAFVCTAAWAGPCARGDIRAADGALAWWSEDIFNHG